MSPEIILRELWEAGIHIQLAQDGVNLIAPAGKLNAEQRALIGEHKASLVALLRKSRDATKALLNAALRRCDQFGDNEKSRAEMRDECLGLPPDLQLDLLKYFDGAPAWHKSHGVKP